MQRPMACAHEESRRLPAADRITGTLLGTALGDALGLATEGMSARAIAPPIRPGRSDST